MKRSFVVDAATAGRRLDAVVAHHLAEVGRRAAQHLLAEHAVRLNGRLARKSDVARIGDVITVDLAPPTTRSLELPTVLETLDYVIVNKPAGVPSTARFASESASVAESLRQRYPEMSALRTDPREAGLIHRLDTQTSGLLVAARRPLALERLRAALRAGAITKRYAAIVLAEALDDGGVVELPLGPHPKSRRRVRVATEGEPRRTEWRVVLRAGPWALLDVQASRAYRHQVRAHLAAVGHPIAGDAVYGGPAAPIGERHALHASYVAWAGDDAVAGFTATAPLPRELAALVGG